MWRYVLGIAISGAIAGALAIKGYHAQGDAKAAYLVGTVVFVPFLGWYASRLLLHGGFDFAGWLRGSLKKEWNGIYYEYATIHLRALEVDGALVFIEEDILQVIEQPGSTTLRLFGPAERIAVECGGRFALTQEGCERLLLKCPHAEAKKLLLYLRRQAFAPFAKRRGRHVP